jgi:hypothetical protein
MGPTRRERDKTLTVTNEDGAVPADARAIAEFPVQIESPAIRRTVNG